MDFSGLKALSVIRDTLHNIEKTRGEKVNIKEIRLDDRKTFKLLKEGKTLGVFRLECEGVRDLMTNWLRPEKFEDIITALALYQPGPLGSGMVNEFLKRKSGRVPFELDHPALEPILSDTYGVVLYQEQIMRIASRLAGFSLEKADVLRKATNSMIPEVIDEQRELFVKGAAKKGGSGRIANRVFDLMTHFGRYASSKAHCTTYAKIAYRTAYLKANYPKEFLATLLSSEMDNGDKLVTYMKECDSLGIKVLPPDINESEGRFAVTGDDIRFGLAAVKNVGGPAIDCVVDVREQKGRFTSLYDFCERVDLRLVDRIMIESLIKCGAFDCFGIARARLMGAIDHALRTGQQKDGLERPISPVDDSGSLGTIRDSVLYPDVSEWHEAELLAFEKDVLGIYLSGHPLNRYEKLIKTYSTTTSAGLCDLRDGTHVGMGGVVTRIKRIATRKCRRLAYVQLEDMEGTTEVIFFPKACSEYARLLREDEIVYVKGTVDLQQSVPRVVAKEVTPISEIERQPGK